MMFRELAASAKSLQLCQTLCDPIDSSPPGSPVPGILQARTLEWVAISFSNAWKWKVKVKLLSRVQLFATPWTAAYKAPLSMGFSRQEHWSGLPFPSPMHEREKWKWSRSVVSNSSRPRGLQPTRLLCPWDFPGKSTGVGCHCLLRSKAQQSSCIYANPTLPNHSTLPLPLCPLESLPCTFSKICQLASCKSGACLCLHHFKIWDGET